MNPSRVRILLVLLVVAACDQGALEPRGTASLALNIVASGPSLIPYATASVRVDGPVSQTISAPRGGTVTFSDLPFGSYVVSAEGLMAGVVVWYDESTVALSGGSAAMTTLQDRAFDAPTPTVSSQSIGSGQQVRVTWVAVRGAAQYSVEWSQAGTSGTNSMTTAQTNADITLSSQGAYSVRVRPTTRSGTPGPFSATPATVTVTATTAPSNLTATATSTSQINLSWTDDSSNETGFKIERCGGAGCSNFAEIATVEANTTTYQNPGLTPGSSYSYRVRAYNGDGNSSYATPATAITSGARPPDPPSDLTATAVSSSRIELSWTDNSTNETGFKIERCSGAGCTTFLEIAIVGADARSYANGGLTAATGFSYRVLAYDGNGSSSYSNTATAITSEPTPTPPNPPSNLAATAVSSSQINLSWTDNASNETGFRIERCSGAGCTSFAEVATVGANTATYSNTGSTPSTSYSYRVRAYNGDGNSNYSNTVTAITSEATLPPPSAPSAPSNLAATAASSSQINLSWTDNSSNETGFRIERCSGAGCASFVEVATVAANTATYQSTGLTPSTSYGYRVRAYNGDGSSSYSNAATAITSEATLPPLPPPSAPSNLAATATSGSQINLSWTDNSSNETGFRIERCSGAGCSSFAEIATVGANTTTYQSTGLTPSTSYGYRVRAYNGDGSSGYSNTATATASEPPLAPPSAPSNLAATATSRSQINLSWTDNSSNETGFRIERCSGTGCTSFAEVATVPANTTTYQNSGLTVLTSYSYRVRAYNGGGSSSYSNTATATTPETPPPAPSNLAAKADKDYRIKLSWTDSSSNETGFKIERCSGAGCTSFAEIATVGANERDYQDKELNPSTSYSYRVRAYNGAGNSGYSNTATAIASK